MTLVDLITPPPLRSLLQNYRENATNPNHKYSWHRGIWVFPFLLFSPLPPLLEPQSPPIFLFRQGLFRGCSEAVQQLAEECLWSISKYVHFMSILNRWSDCTLLVFQRQWNPVKFPGKPPPCAPNTSLPHCCLNGSVQVVQYSRIHSWR
jgi:hypothetical protein